MASTTTGTTTTTTTKTITISAGNTIIFPVKFRARKTEKIRELLRVYFPDMVHRPAEYHTMDYQRPRVVRYWI